MRDIKGKAFRDVKGKEFASGAHILERFEARKFSSSAIDALLAPHSSKILIHLAGQVYWQKRTATRPRRGGIFHCYASTQVVI